MARKPKTGKVIRLSTEVMKYLDALRQPREGYDACLRRQFGLTARNGHEQPLTQYYVLDTANQLIIRRTLAEARGDAILLAVRKGQKLTDKQKKESVRIVRELPA